MMNYRIVDINNDDWLELLDEPYKGIIYKYGKVDFNQSNNQCTMNFEYFLYDTSLCIDCNFKQVIGDILLELIDEKLHSNELIYHGGVGEGRDQNY